MDNENGGVVFLTITETQANGSFHASGPIDEVKRLYAEWLAKQASSVTKS